MLVTVIVSPFFTDIGFGSNAGLPCTDAPSRIVNGVPAAAVAPALTPVAFAAEGAVVAFAPDGALPVAAAPPPPAVSLVFQSCMDEQCNRMESLLELKLAWYMSAVAPASIIEVSNGFALFGSVGPVPLVTV